MKKREKSLSVKKQKFPLDSLHSDVLRIVMMETPIDELLELCSSNKKMNAICEDDSFWHGKLLNDYPKEVSLLTKVKIPLNAVSYKDTYKALYHTEENEFLSLDKDITKENFEKSIPILAKSSPIVVGYIYKKFNKKLNFKVKRSGADLITMAVHVPNYPLVKWLLSTNVPVSKFLIYNMTNNQMFYNEKFTPKQKATTKRIEALFDEKFPE